VGSKEREGQINEPEFMRLLGKTDLDLFSEKKGNKITQT
jgi:hypothetical protein